MCVAKFCHVRNTHRIQNAIEVVDFVLHYPGVEATDGVIDGIAKLIQVPAVKIPAYPDELPDPKQVLLNLARKSKSRRFASEFVPVNGSKAKHGPLYNQHLTAFADKLWDSRHAELASPSLKRAIHRVKEFAQRLQA